MGEGRPPEDDMLGRVQSLVRAFGLLDELAKTDGLSLSDIARRIDLPKSTVHRLLTTMEALRYVEFDRASHRWAIGVQAFTVGAAFAQTRDLGKLGRSIMRSLVSEVHHSVNISVPEGTGMCFVGQVTPNETRQNLVRPGACLPLHTTAAGKVLMAHWPRDELDRFLDGRNLSRRTGKSIVDRAHIYEELASVRQRGYAFDDEEHADGLRCVAAVVLDRYGMPKASLSISDAAPRLDRVRMDELGPTLMLAAQEMGHEIAKNIGF